MNKLIPFTLTAVIAVAMVFAIAPSDYATTAHVSTPSAATVNSASIADNTITSADILANTIVAADIAADTITPAELSDTLTMDAATSIITLNGAITVESAAGDSGAALKGILTGTAVADGGAMAGHGGTQAITVTVTGTAAADIPICSLSGTDASLAGVSISKTSATVNTVRVTLSAVTAITPATTTTVDCIVFDIS